MSVAMQRLVDFISIVTQQYVNTQQYCTALLAGFSVGRDTLQCKTATEVCHWQRVKSNTNKSTHPIFKECLRIVRNGKHYGGLMRSREVSLLELAKDFLQNIKAI
jgi:hypothetical protein